jgi:predicted RNA-binding Zn-ribbon protein involved in translation (DUF1610 family)
MGDTHRFAVTGVNVVGKWDWSVKMKCTVCNLDVRKGQDIVQCPYCGNVSHKAHILEWLHVKNTCPACNEHLSESELQRFRFDEEK